MSEASNLIADIDFFCIYGIIFLPIYEVSKEILL